MKNNLFLKLTPVVLIPLIALLYILLTDPSDTSTLSSSTKTTSKENSTKGSENKAASKKYEDEFVIFFSQNMAEKTAQKLFFDEHKNVIWLQNGNFPGVAVVKIKVDQKETIAMLKEKDYIDLIIPNQEGLECHSEE